MESRMDIVVVRHDAAAVLKVAGSLDAMTAETLFNALTSELEGGYVRLIADFQEVHYASSAGLRVILRGLKDAKRKGGDFRLAGAQGNVYKVLKLSGFTGILQCFDDAEQALASFGG